MACVKAYAANRDKALVKAKDGNRSGDSTPIEKDVVFPPRYVPTWVKLFYFTVHLAITRGEDFVGRTIYFNA